MRPIAMGDLCQLCLRTLAVLALACVCDGAHNMTYKIAVVSVIHLVLAQRNLNLGTPLVGCCNDFGSSQSGSQKGGEDGRERK
jgi:hypothetical protein